VLLDGLTETSTSVSRWGWFLKKPSGFGQLNPSAIAKYTAPSIVTQDTDVIIVLSVTAGGDGMSFTSDEVVEVIKVLK
jgi:hypothetical protein